METNTAPAEYYLLEQKPSNPVRNTTNAFIFILSLVSTVLISWNYWNELPDLSLADPWGKLGFSTMIFAITYITGRVFKWLIIIGLGLAITYLAVAIFITWIQKHPEFFPTNKQGTEVNIHL